MTSLRYDVLRGLAGAGALVILLAGCENNGSATTGHSPAHRHARAAARRSPAPTASTDAAPAAAAQAREELVHLVVRPRPRGTRGYVRDAFGGAWVDTDHDGCNQRDDVLLHDAVPGTTEVAQQGACDHDVLAGTWHDPYTGRTLRFTDLKDLSQAEAIQIDHVVPLAEAWVSGADGWHGDRREAFANDLHELLAVDGPTNMAKGDGDPAA